MGPCRVTYAQHLMMNLAALIGMAFVGCGAQPTGTGTIVQPRIFRPGEVVLFQGDSITDGNRGRSADPNHILGHGYVFAISARYGADFAQDNLTFVNRGISGNTLSNLEARWDEDTLKVKPTVLSILVGINDICQPLRAGKSFDLAGFEAQYRKLLDRTLKDNPSLRLVLCKPFTVDTGQRHAEYDQRKQLVESAGKAIERLAKDYHAPAVDFQKVFDAAAKLAPMEHWIWDGVHPTYSGHQLMADEWVRVYNEFYVSPLEDPARNSAIAPEVNFERDSYDWLHRHTDILDAKNQAQPDLVMIGDSITHFWGGTPLAKQQNGPKAWKELMSGLKVLNMGCGWDRTQNVLWRIQHGELDGVNPKAIVLLIGTNNLVGDSTARTNTPEEVAVGIRTVVSQLLQRCPEAKITVMAVFPRGFDTDNPLDLAIRKLNGLVKQTLEGVPRVSVLDIGAKLRSSNGAVTKDMFSDGTHPTEKGYRVWGQALADAGVLKK